MSGAACTPTDTRWVRHRLVWFVGTGNMEHLSAASHALRAASGMRASGSVYDEHHFSARRLPPPRRCAPGRMSYAAGSALRARRMPSEEAFCYSYSETASTPCTCLLGELQHVGNAFWAGHACFGPSHLAAHIGPFVRHEHCSMLTACLPPMPAPPQAPPTAASRCGTGERPPPQPSPFATMPALPRSSSGVHMPRGPLPALERTGGGEP